MKCHYEVLEVSRDANNDDLKKAYRKAALKWHPDKNLDNPDQAKEQFQLVQQAYEVLTDPHERSWYDAHRDAILKGGLGGDYQDDTFDVFPYFTSSCFKGYGDDEKGFYSVYREVFNKIAAEDADYMDEGDSDNEAPDFGNSTSDFKEVVHPFYAYWSNYTTKKSYSWLDQYDIRDLPNRRVAKLVEKENKKIRDRARRDRNEQIRNLVAFVRKRDKRVQAQAKIVEEQNAEKARKSEEKRRAKLRERQAELKDYQESEWSKFSNFENELKNIEKSIQAEYGDQDLSCDDDESGQNGNDESVQENVAYDGFYCPACQKLFKTDKAFANHENSKKHKENVELLKQTMREEEEGLEDMEEEEAEEDTEEGDCGEDEQDEDIEEEEDIEEIKVEQPDSEKELDKESAESTENCSDSENVPSSQLNLPSAGKGSKSRKKKNVKQPTVDSDEDDLSSDGDFAMLSKKQRRKLKLQKQVENSKKDTKEEAEPVVEQNGEVSETEPVNGDDVKPENNDVNVPKPKTKSKKSKEARKQKRQESAASVDPHMLSGGKKADKSRSKQNEAHVDAENTCVTCKSNFPSKNKLFDHLKKTGHSVYIPKTGNDVGSISIEGPKKGKGKRK